VRRRLVSEDWTGVVWWFGDSVWTNETEGTARHEPRLASRRRSLIPAVIPLLHIAASFGKSHQLLQLLEVYVCYKLVIAHPGSETPRTPTLPHCLLVLTHIARLTLQAHTVLVNIRCSSAALVLS
jgi:hypothetical protein